ncbi:MAG: right-handed parallel beta-helix repeat-containing protein [Planctomycetota bacterium]
MRRTYCVAIVLCFFGAFGLADTIHVPASYPTIQGGINAAVNGDIILVAAGTYVENIDFLGKTITVMSSSGPDLTTLDGNKAGSVITFQSGEGLGSVIDGFTITNGSAVDFGGGVNCHQSSPTIVNNIIIGNEAVHGGGISGYISSFFISNNTITVNISSSSHGEGGGIYCNGFSLPSIHPTISGNTISYNYSSSVGGGIMCSQAYATISNNHISNNQATNDGGGIEFTYYGSDVNPSTGPARVNIISENKISFNNAQSGGGIHCEGSGGELRIFSNEIYKNTAHYGGGLVCSDGSMSAVYNNLIHDNSATGSIVGGGGGVYCNSNPTLVNNTITSNTASIRGGGVYCVITAPSITNSIVWNNSAPDSAEIFGAPEVNYSDIKGGWVGGTGNIGVNPFFTTGPKGDYYLSMISPCVNTGSVPSMNLALHTCGTRTDGNPDTGLVDMGFHYGPFTIPTLTTDVYQVSETGGKVHYSLNAGAGQGGRSYLILAGASGIEPGYPLPGGYVTLPVNLDNFTYLVLFPLLNTIVYQNFMGILSPAGLGEATMNTGVLPPGYVGLRMFYAYCLAYPWEFVSNPVEIDIIP